MQYKLNEYDSTQFREYCQGRNKRHILQYGSMELCKILSLWESHQITTIPPESYVEVSNGLLELNCLIEKSLETPLNQIEKDRLKDLRTYWDYNHKLISSPILTFYTL